MSLASKSSKVVMKKLSFRPFRAYRPRNDVAAQLTCEPYNKTNTQEARECALKDETSFLHVIKPEIDLAEPVRPYSNPAGEQGKKSLQNLISQELLIRDKKPSFYLYKQQKNGLSHTCIIGQIAVQNYYDGLIMPHEQTILEKELALEQFTRTQNAHVDPVLLTHKSSNNIDAFIKANTTLPPTQHFVSEDGLLHTVWALDSPDNIENIQTMIENVPGLYIADGHHRSAVAKRMKQNAPDDPLHPYHHLLVALAPDSHVLLNDYNRIIKDTGNLSAEEFLDKLATHFTIAPVDSAQQAKPHQQHHFGMYLNGSWHTLETKPSILQARKDPLKRVDTSILNDLVIEPILGITNLYHSDHIECAGGFGGAAALENKCHNKGWDLAFALYPVPMQQFMNVVDSGQLMPAKTTWFEPKMRPGLIVRVLE